MPICKKSVIIITAVMILSAGPFKADTIFAQQDANVGMVGEETTTRREMAEVSRKLNGIVETQKAILEEIRQVKGDMAVLKIRVTQNQ